MVTELPASVRDQEPVVAEDQIGRSPPSKNFQCRAPKKIHKAEREKLKRDHLNELFYELGHALEPARQNNGKASILGDATRLLKDLSAQVESLRRENAALLTESRYMNVETKELRDEKLALEGDIQNLKNELQERIQSNPTWRNAADAAPATVMQPTTTALSLQQRPPVVQPVYVIPFNQELPAYPPEAVPTFPSPDPPPLVTRPHARYPTPSDSWPMQILWQQRRTSQGGEHSGGGSSSATGCSSSRECSAEE